MKDNPSFSILDKEQRKRWESFDVTTLVLLFGLGSFSLDGPSFLLLGFNESKGQGPYDLIHMRLTPFEQEVKIIGSFDSTKAFEEGADLSIFYPYLKTPYAPSLLLSSSFLSEKVSQDFYASSFIWRGDGFALLEAVKEIPLMSGVRNGKLLKAMRSGKYPPPDERELTENEASSLASHLLKEQHTDYEYKGFLLFWMDLDQLSKKQGHSITMAASGFGSFFSHVERTCRFKRGAQLNRFR